MRYWVQTQAPAGGWTDSMGTDELEEAGSFAAYQQKSGHRARVVERTDVVVLADCQIRGLS